MIKRTKEDNDVRIAVALVGSKPVRSWPAQKYAEVFRQLVEENGGKRFTFVLLGGNDSFEAAKTVKDALRENVLDLTGKTTLNQAMSVVSLCDMYIGSDTGLMHMASVARIPVIELSASSDITPDYWGSSPERTGPWLVKNIVLRPQKPGEGCAYFCSKTYPHCIDLISVEEVYSSMKMLISELK